MEITLNNHSDTHLTFPDKLELNKILTIIAGPNGYGKSSLLMEVKRSNLLQLNSLAKVIICDEMYL